MGCHCGGPANHEIGKDCWPHYLSDFKQRAEQAERERDEWKLACTSADKELVERIRERDEARAEVRRLRVWLMKIETAGRSGMAWASLQHMARAALEDK